MRKAHILSGIADMQSLFLKEWRYFAKVNVVSSNLIARSKFFHLVSRRMLKTRATLRVKRWLFAILDNGPIFFTEIAANEKN